MQGMKRKRHGDNGPFHTFVVTSPDCEAAKAALKGPLKGSNLPFGNDRRTNDFPLIISTSDPFDTRVGSGGGTLQALSEADKPSGQNQEHGSVCIIHAGGQSSRCPTQMVLGKAWTSLPIVHKHETHEFVSNPTYILMQSLSKLLQNLPHGSVVVAASDVLLHLPETPMPSLDQVPHDKILGLAVPAPLHTAKNHGVFCISSSLSDNDPLSIQPVDRFLQKPTQDEMEQTMGCTFNNERGEKMALVDTGVVIFLPDAAKALREMMTNELIGCTSSGIEYLYNEYVEACDNTPTSSCSDYAKRCAIKIELYSHILLAVSTMSSLSMPLHQRLETYLSNPSVKGVDEIVLKKIYNRMSQFELHVLYAKEGHFTHLGTTAELCQFLVDGAKQCVAGVRHNHGSFSLTNRANTFCQNLSGGKDSVIMNSLIRPQYHNLQMGDETVVEYCHITNDHFIIGDNCVLSGWRGPWTSNVQIPDSSLFQMMPLKRDTGNMSTTTEYVCIFQGIHDDIKSRSTYFGVAFDEVFQRTLLEPTDVWSEDSSRQTLWNARLHPIIRICDSAIEWDMFSWILPLMRGERLDDRYTAHLQKWKKLKRLSLSEIQAKADTSIEFSYRSNLSQEIADHLSHTLKSIQDLFQDRRHEEINLDFALDPIRASSFHVHNMTMDKTLCIFEELILLNVQRKSSFDICCRICMVLSSFINTIASIVSHDETTEQSSQTLKSSALTLVNLSNDGENQYKHFQDFFKELRSCICDLPGSFDFIIGCATDLEEVAHKFTAQCISTDIHILSSLSHESLPSINVWTVVTAPGRVDLAGGWSDTPPISYEYGGAVTNIAVTVDGIKPISVRCRRVHNLSGIILRTESREIKTGDIKESNSVTVYKLGDLADYANPSGKCSLLKCALFAVGLLSPSLVQNQPKLSIEDILQKELLVDKDGTRFGLEVISTSLLPHGSGLGTSSILAACVLASLGACIGLKDANDPHWLVQKVLLMEALHSTGGGWQDQVGGIFPGVKLCKSQINQYPVDISVESFQLSQSTIDELNGRMVLGFTGKPRLAKNILQNVLRRFALRKEEIMTTVEKLVCGANDAFKAIQAHDFELVGKLVSEYWEQKCVMAGGEGSGVEPEEVRKLFDLFKKSNLIEGGTLCGAGGGGFMFLLLKKNVNLQRLEETMKLNGLNDLSTVFIWYSCQVSKEGLNSFTSTVDDFDFSWHCPIQIERI